MEPPPEPTDWLAAAESMASARRAGLRKSISETISFLDANPQHAIQPTNTMEARRRSYNADLERMMESLHRRHIAFTHVPRQRTQQHRRLFRRHPFTVERDAPVPFEGPVLTKAAAHELLQRLAERRPGQAGEQQSPEAVNRHSPGDHSESLDRLLATTFSPRRGGASTSNLDNAVHRAWFSGGMQAGTAEQRDEPPPRNVTQLTASSLRRQGLNPVEHERRGDGYVSPSEGLRLRREYAEQTYGYRRLRHHERRPVAGAKSSTIPLEELLAGVFVKAGDVGSFIRQGALDAGLPRSGANGTVKSRLGGTSKPRL
jgi:hypothetical protein